MTQPSSQRFLTESRRGAVGGVAALDNLGNVVDAFGNPAGSGGGTVKTVNGVPPGPSGDVAIPTGSSPTYATLPPGVIIAIPGTARPTTRADLVIRFTGTDPGVNALEGDEWRTT
jgi:hypothetical protein